MNPTLVWLFDLDDTLHNASAAVFPAISKNMVEFIANMLGNEQMRGDDQQADALRLEYLHRYGATLKGVVSHHGVKQEDFLKAAHQFEHLPSLLQLEKGLAASLNRLPGRKILFTNAPEQYAREVVRFLRVHHQFADHISIESMRVHGESEPKPSKAFLKKWLSQHKLCAQNCVLVEDSVKNLRAAKEVGMKTVLVTGFRSHTSQHKGISTKADLIVKSVFDLTRNFRQLYRY